MRDGETRYVYLLLSSNSPVLHGHRKVTLIVLAYPVEESEIFVGKSRADPQGTLSMYDPNGRILPFTRPQFRALNKSSPLQFEFESTEDECLFIRITQNVFLLDVFFFDSEAYSRFVRLWDLRRDEIQL